MAKRWINLAGKDLDRWDKPHPLERKMIISKALREHQEIENFDPEEACKKLDNLAKIEDVSICVSGTVAVTDTSTCISYADMLRSDGGKLSNDANVKTTDCTYIVEGLSGSGSSGVICYKPCPAGWYTNIEGIQCTQCPLGRYSANSGQLSIDACVSCDQGKYPGADIAQSDCKSCPKGYALNRDAKDSGGVCDTCVIGKYTNAIEQLTCLSCSDVQPGTTTDHAAATEVTDCSACLAGRFRSTINSNCEVCGAGQYIEDVTATGVTSTCVECADGSYILPTSGGFEQHDEKSDCQLCDIGTKWTTSTTACGICGAGTYADQTGKTDCSECQKNTYLQK